ncbi:DUF6541 family protein [Leucobacter chromiireducens]|uniref:DUF6541 family protein n=1 Tax=Leucobacter chromiireducens TaxID=283877 RepID=UPI000F62D5DA|nr:DUF6541 family protein [Leucobacter chromiireducens]
MIAWLPLITPTAAAIFLLVALGLPLSLALRLRGFFAIAVAIPASLAVVAIASVLAPLVKVHWSPLAPFALGIVVAVLLLFCARRVGPVRRNGAGVHRTLVPVGAAALGGLAIAVSLILSMKSADAISQTFDANFHLNAVRQILETGSASPLDMDLAAPGSHTYYPTLWHGFVALVAQLSGASIPLATNATVFVVCTVVWPIGVVLLGRALAGPSTRVAIVSGIVSAAFPNFPLSLAGYGVLYPNLLAIALAPFIFTGIIQLCGLSNARRAEGSSIVAAALLTIGSLGAAIFAHPNAIHITLIWMIVPATTLVYRALRGRRVPGWSGALVEPLLPRTARRTTALFGLPLLGLAIVVAWAIGRTTDNPWEGKHEVPGALLDALGMTPRLEGHAWPVTLLFLFGLVAIARSHRRRWVGYGALIPLAFYVIADGFPASEWRTFFLSPWYSDPWRLAALIWVGALPLVVIGASAAAAWFDLGLRSSARFLPHPRISRIVGLTFGALFLLAATQGAGAFAGVQYVSTKYETDAAAPLLDTDERALLERLESHVPEGQVIANNPWNGGALAYAIADREVLVPHTGGKYDPRINEMLEGIATGTPQACSLSHELNARFVLDLGTHYVFPETPRAEPYRTISGIDSADATALTEVDREGEAVLYEITGC